MDYYDQIEAYLNNTLTEIERSAFEEAMGKDEELKQAVEDHDVAMDVVGSILEGKVRGIIRNEELIINNEGGIENGKLKIENDVGGVAGQVGTKDKRVRRMNWMRWASAAVVVFVLGWWGMSVNVKMKQSDRHAFVSNDIDKPVIDDIFRSTDSAQNLIEEARQLYSLNDYNKAKPKYEELLKFKEYENEAKLCLGYINLIKNNYSQSIKYLEFTRESGYRLRESSQLLVYNYFIIGNKAGIEKLKSEDSNLFIPIID